MREGEGLAARAAVGPARPRVLLIAEAANPEWVSVPLVGWSHARAIAALASVHLVTHARNREAIRRAGLGEGEFTAIDSDRVAGPLWRIACRLRGGEGKGWTTVSMFQTLAYPYFERLVWRRFGEAIGRGEYDLVHRLTPLSPVQPSPLARRCARAGVPFVLGPLNGGLPWPRGSGGVRRREREWLSHLRRAAFLLPGWRGTWRHARAILAGSLDTLRQIPARHRDKCVYLPENGVTSEDVARGGTPRPGLPLRVAFAGRLVPYKGPGIVVEALAPLLRAGSVRLEILGDGPERASLEERVEREGIAGKVAFRGWLDRARILEALSRSHLLALPSIREFGGGVVLEAAAAGAVPIVVGYGGPAELVTEGTGFKIPLGSPEEMARGLRAIVSRLLAHPSEIAAVAGRARARAREHFTWDVKAAQTLEVYRWVLGQRPLKPDFGIPLGIGGEGGRPRARERSLA